MTLGTTIPAVAHAGNGVTTSFAVPFAFFGADELAVILRDGDGGEALQALTTHYTVSGGNGAAGTVTMLAAPAEGTTLHIGRQTARSQLVDYQPNDTFPAETHERALDRLQAQIQELEARQNQGALLARTSPTAGPLSLPEPVGGRVLKWTAAGDGLENSASDPDDLAADAAASAAAAAGSASAASGSAAAAAASAADAAGDAASAAASATEAAGYAASLDLPGGAGHGGQYLRQKSGEDGLEYRSAAQLLADAGAEIDGLALLTSPGSADALLIGNGGAAKKITWDRLMKIQGLTEDAGPSAAADFLLAYSSAAGAARKVKLGTLRAATALPGHIFGLTLANNATDPANDIDIAPGSAAADASPWWLMELAAGLTKRLDAAWSAGSGQGGLDTGSIANITYHVFLIRRSDTGAVDALFSSSATSPTLPPGYDQKRRVGSILRTNGTIIAFQQTGDRFLWDIAANDVTATNPGTAAVTRTLTIPTGIVVDALVTAIIFLGTNNNCYGLITALDQANVAPSSSNANCVAVGAVNDMASAEVQAKTNTSGQVRSRISNSGAGDVLVITTRGWVDVRGRLG